ncbi:arsenate reductase (glutaredoxin) [bacterium SCSIO 12696]|nr:arsenate reductase (glutaredoxin) [bacterium SCSIO 12696]
MTTIYHNPRCSKSRQTLQLLEEKGIEPTVVLYLENTPDADAITDLLAKLGIGPRQLIRTGEQAYKDNNLANPELSDAQLIQAMAEHPKLIQRPIVVNGDKAALGRPPEAVLDIL